MTNEQSTLERAFDLGRNGTCRTMRQLRANLKAEQCEGVEEHLSGRVIVRQLQAIMKSKTAS